VGRINRAECRRELLERADMKWPGKFTRVEAGVLDALDTHVGEWIQSFVRAHPTLGKTLSTGERRCTHEEGNEEAG